SLAVADDWGHINFYEPDQGEEPAVQLDVESLPRALQFRDRGRTLAAFLEGGGFIQLEARTGRILLRREPPPLTNSAVRSRARIGAAAPGPARAVSSSGAGICKRRASQVGSSRINIGRPAEVQYACSQFGSSCLHSRGGGRRSRRRRKRQEG